MEYSSIDYSSYNPNQQQQQPQQQQQQQQQSYYEYDPSQIQYQPYDQSYATAAAATYQPSYYGYNQQYGYYPTDTSSQVQHYVNYQPEPVPVHPPGVNPEPVQPRPNNLPVGSSQYRGRGGRTFKRGGRGRGQFNPGRGRGVGGGRHFPTHSSGPAISDVQGSSSVAGATLGVQGSSAQVQPPPRAVFCDICKVECNTPEIMELHKRGKKHLKNVRLHEAKQRRGAAINGPQSGQTPTSQLNSTDQTLIAQESEDPTKNTSSEIAADNHKVEMNLQNNVGETSEVPAEEHEGLGMENSGARGRGLKRKLRGGKGRKLMRTTDGSKAEPAIAITCELCNVKCDTQLVYQSHVAGKKHLKRAYGYQASAGRVNQIPVGVNQIPVGVNQIPVGVVNQISSEVGPQALSEVLGLQALYPPDINALANQINAQVQQGDNDPQVLLAQLLMNVLSQAQGSATAPPNGNLAAQTPAPTSVAGSSYEPQLTQTQVSEIAAPVDMGNPIGESKNEMLSQAQGSATAPPNGTLAAQTPTPPSVAGNPTGESKNEMLSVPLEGSNVAQEGSNVVPQIEGGSSETK